MSVRVSVSAVGNVDVPVAMPASINNQTEIVNGERGHYLVWSVRVMG